MPAGSGLSCGGRWRSARSCAQSERRRDAQRPALADEDGAIHHRRHLADVARPAVLRQHPHVVVRDGDRPQAEPMGGAFGKVLGKRPDVAGTVAQGRNHDRKHRQPVVEILAERLRLDHRRQIAMRGGDDADVDAHGPLTADADQFAILDDAEQPDLRRRRRARRPRRERGCRRRPARTSLCAASMAPVNAPCSWPNSSESISSGAIAPQFTRRNGPRAERRVLVDGARDDLLAGAGLAEEQDRCGAARHQPRPGHDRRKAGVAANQTLVADGPIAGDQMFRYGSQRGSRRVMFL